MSSPLISDLNSVNSDLISDLNSVNSFLISDLNSENSFLISDLNSENSFLISDLNSENSFLISDLNSENLVSMADISRFSKAPRSSLVASWLHTTGGRLSISVSASSSPRTSIRRLISAQRTFSSIGSLAGTTSLLALRSLEGERFAIPEQWSYPTGTPTPPQPRC